MIISRGQCSGKSASDVPHTKLLAINTDHIKIKTRNNGVFLTNVIVSMYNPLYYELIYDLHQ